MGANYVIFFFFFFFFFFTSLQDLLFTPKMLVWLIPPSRPHAPHPPPPPPQKKSSRYTRGIPKTTMYLLLLFLLQLTSNCNDLRVHFTSFLGPPPIGAWRNRLGCMMFPRRAETDRIWVLVNRLEGLSLSRQSGAGRTIPIHVYKPFWFVWAAVLEMSFYLSNW